MCRLSRYKGVGPDSRNTHSAGHRVIPALDSSEAQTLLILSASMYTYTYACVYTQSPGPVVWTQSPPMNSAGSGSNQLVTSVKTDQ